MKMVKFLLIVLIGLVGVVDVNAQTVHTYFTREIYPGLYAQVIYGEGYILMRLGEDEYTRLNYSHEQDNVLFYSDGSSIVAIVADGSALSVASGNQVVGFSYVSPVVTPSPYSVFPSYSPAETTQIKCYFCDGTGKTVKNDHIPQYGLSDYETYTTCSECGFRYCSTRTNHYHATCSNCFGKGYIER